MSLSINIKKKLANFTLETALFCSPGTLTAIVGPSGSGKTTLMRIIAGLDQPDIGFIKLHEQIWNDTENHIFTSPQKRSLGYVFQEHTLFPHLSVSENVRFSAPDKNNVEKLLTRFGIDHLAHRKPSKLSGGERQRTAICQALASNPSALLMDEPFSSLDVATKKTLRDEITTYKKKLHIPVIHITHDLEEASILADQTFVLENGRASPNWLSRQINHQEIAPAQTDFSELSIQ